MNDLFEIVKGILPNSEILLIYYSGSKAYGLDSEDSDLDVTVVLDNFNGILQLNTGLYDLFVYSKENYIKRQNFDKSIISYYKQAADDVLLAKDNLVYINPSFESEFDKLLAFDDKELIVNHVTAVLDFCRIRYSIKPDCKSLYHLFRVRGMVEHYQETGKYEYNISNEWKNKMINYKINQEHKDEINGMLNYLSELISNGLD